MSSQTDSLRLLLAKPEQMIYWSKPENLVNFLAIQASFHHSGASPTVSPTGIVLDDCIDKLSKLYKIGKYKESEC